jgi:hypothetical protein
LVSQRRCSFVESAPARHGAFIWAGGSADSYWLYTAPEGLTLPTRLRVDCVGGTLFSCGTPTIRGSSSSGLSGNDLFSIFLDEIADFNRLTSTKVP